MSDFNMGPQFASIRRDGIGARLLVLLNAMALADFFGGDFAFDWPEDGNTGSGDALTTADQFFASPFLERHFRPGLADMVESAGPGIARGMTPARAQKLRNGDAAPAQWNIAGFQDLRQVLPLRDGIYRDLFDRIEFTPRIREALDAAAAVPLSLKARAFHMRAGDVINSDLRFKGRFSRKVLPFPLAVELARAEGAAGNEVLVFGQDPEVLALIRDASGGRLAADLLPEHLRLARQAWFFEFALMARCNAIISGTFSCFSQAASWIGLAEKVDGYECMEALTVRDVILNEDTAAARVSDLQKAQAYWSLYDVYSCELPEKDTTNALLHASTLDPDNGLYTLSRINEYARAGNNSRTRSALRQYLREQRGVSNDRPGGLARVAAELALPLGRKTRETCLGAILALARQGDPDASVIGALAANDAHCFSFFCRHAARSRYRFFFRADLERRRQSLRALPEGLPPAYFRFGRLRRAFGLLPPAGTPTNAPAPPPTPPAERPGSVRE
jgi:hypothetical protein